MGRGTSAGCQVAILLLSICWLTQALAVAGPTISNCPTPSPSDWVVLSTNKLATRALVELVSSAAWVTLVVGTRGAPTTWEADFQRKLNLRNGSETTGAWKFLSAAQQKGLGYQILDVAAQTDRNVGYLYAIGCQATKIMDLAADATLTSDEVQHAFSQAVFSTPPGGFYREASGDIRTGVVNPYALFGVQTAWPRGHPRNSSTGSVNLSHEFYRTQAVYGSPALQPLVQQVLSNMHPDVDSAWCLKASKHMPQLQTSPSLFTVRPGSWAPFNARSTVFLRESFWGLLLPVSTSPQVADIWRSYWVQRLLWDVNGQLVYRAPLRSSTPWPRSVCERNVTSSVSEAQLNTQSATVVNVLSTWVSNKTELPDVILQVAALFAEHEFWSPQDEALTAAWLADLQDLDYSFPAVLRQDSTLSHEPAARLPVDTVLGGQLPAPALTARPMHRRFAALCFTGQADRASAAMHGTLQKLKGLLADMYPDATGRGVDVFGYVSTFRSCPEEISGVIHFPFNASTIYNDIPLSLQLPIEYDRWDIESEQRRRGITPQNYLQQYYGQKRCFELIEEFAEQHNISYDMVARLRTDHIIGDIARNLTGPVDSSAVYVPEGHDYGTGRWRLLALNDRIGWGPWVKMKVYMKRFDLYNSTRNLELGPSDTVNNLHPERMLGWLLRTKMKFTIKRVPLPYTEVPHGLRICDEMCTVNGVLDNNCHMMMIWRQQQAIQQQLKQNATV